MVSGGLNAIICSSRGRHNAARPYCSMCSFVAQNCPWSVRSPQGEFLRERRRLKIVALGSRAHSLCLGPWPALSLWSQIGPNDAILEQIPSPSLEPSNSPFFFLQHPITKRSDQLRGSSVLSDARASVSIAASHFPLPAPAPHFANCKCKTCKRQLGRSWGAKLESG